MGQYVQFDEGPDIVGDVVAKRRKSWPTKLVMMLPGVNTDTKANIAMLVIVLILLGASFTVFSNLFDLNKDIDNAKLADILSEEELNALPGDVRAALLSE